MKKKIVPGQMIFELDDPFDIKTAIMPDASTIHMESEKSIHVNNPELKDLKHNKKTEKDSSKNIFLLKKSAESLLKQAEKLNTECAGNYTRKRQAQADSNLKKKDRLLSWRKILLRLATEWENETIPEIVRKITKVSDLEFLIWTGGFPKEPDGDSADWYKKEYPGKLKKAKSLGAINKEIYGDIVCLLGEYMLEEESEPQKVARKLREMLKEVHSYNIPGFYPTPDELIDVMLEHADLSDENTLLEPSAGIGSILERVLYHGCECRMDCVEINPSLAEILRFKGFHVSCEDIMETKEVTGSKWDRNPPFEKGQDIDHVMHCFNTFLKEKGKLISIMSSGAIKGTTKKHKEFHDFRKEHHAYYVENGQAFKNAFNATGVNSIILIVDKP